MDTDETNRPSKRKASRPRRRKGPPVTPLAEWENIAFNKRVALYNSIPEKWRIPYSLTPDGHEPALKLLDSSFFSARDLELTSLSATATVEKLRSREWTSEEVTSAYCKRAAGAHQLTNCLSETLFTQALARAKELDAQLAHTGVPAGPLHGLPISLKDNFEIPGVDSTLGFVGYVGQPAQHESALVGVLRRLGAVVYVKTNVPTAMMIAETVNNVFTRTVNPRDPKLTAGGSSGGEAALLSFGGSCLGVGTDIGGSLRIPAAMCGLFTLRPSLGRFPTGGAKSGLPGQESVLSVNGPMARSLEDIELFARTVVGAESWKVDPRVVPLPWREVPVQERLKIGVLWHDGQVEPTPPVQRALKHTVDKLREAGHEVVDWAPDLHKELSELRAAFFLSDGGKSIKSVLDKGGEPWRPEMRDYEVAEELGVAQLWQLQAKRTQLATEYLARVQQAGIDAILCPTTPYACVEHGKFRYVDYTGVFNVLDYSAVSFPTGLLADSELDAGSGSGGEGGLMSAVDGQTKQEYDAAAIHGSPISLQLVAGRLEEEKALMMVGRVVGALS